jgi:hypothetical protein
MASFIFEMNRWKGPIVGLVTYSMVRTMRSAPASSGAIACQSLLPLKITIAPGGVASRSSCIARVESPL